MKEIRGIPVSCNSCGATFACTIQQEQLADKRIGYFFTCSKCGRKYTVASITKKGIRIRNELHILERLTRNDPEQYGKKYRTKKEEYAKEFTGAYEEE